MKRHAFWQSERGFTLVEVMVTIIIMGIVFAATNQLAADLRQAHSKATNRLTDWRVVLTADSQSYQLVKPAAPAETIPRSLPDDTEIGTTKTVAFKADGSATVVTGAGNTIVVRSTDDSPQQHTIEFNTTTSRIQIDPPTP